MPDSTYFPNWPVLRIRIFFRSIDVLCAHAFAIWATLSMGIYNLLIWQVYQIQNYSSSTHDSFYLFCHQGSITKFVIKRKDWSRSHATFQNQVWLLSQHSTRRWVSWKASFQSSRCFFVRYVRLRRSVFVLIKVSTTLSYFFFFFCLILKVIIC